VQNNTNFSTKELWLFGLFISILFSLNLIYYFQKYKDFKTEQVYTDSFFVQTVYDDKETIKFSNGDFTFNSKIKNCDLEYLDVVNITIPTQNVDFKEYLSQFWTKSFMIQKTNKKHNQLLFDLTKQIENMHPNSEIASFFNALFFGTNLTQKIQNQSINLGILHLIALSGYHLSVIAGVVYLVFGAVYRFLHAKYFPYRNYKFDLLLISSIIITFYVYLAGFIPSLIRSFAMYLFAIFMLRKNIKILSYLTLLIVGMFLIALFPPLLFSIGFWFSIWGIFYIYLYMQYFSKLNKIVSFVFFNFWVFFAMNPLVHYFFNMTSLWQLSSPFFTIFFVIFFPAEIILHFLNLGHIFDFLIEAAINFETTRFAKDTILEVFIIFLGLSIGSIYSKTIFYIFNFALIIYSFWLFI
jgi:competence protein ComEC